MPIPLFGKLISGTGNPYADADQVEVDATGFDGNLETTDTTVQAVAQKLDDLVIPTGGNTQQRIALPGSSLTIDASNVGTYNGNILYLSESYIGTDPYVITVTVDLNFDLIDIANFSDSRSIRLNNTGVGTIDGQTSVTIPPNEGRRLVDQPNAGGQYHFLFGHDRTADSNTDNYVDTLSYSNGVLTAGRTGSLSDLTASIPAGEVLEVLTNASGSTIPAGQPVIAITHTDGSRRMVRARTNNVGHNIGPNTDENYIYGFVTEDVANGASSRPVRAGVISNVLLQASNNETGQELVLNTLNGVYRVSDTLATSDGFADFVGHVIGSVDDLTNRYTVYISLDLALSSREYRLQEEVDGKEDGLGNPTTDGFVLSSTAAGVRSWIAQGSGGGGLTAVGTPTDGQYAQWASATSLRGLDGIPSSDIVLEEVLVTANGLISVPDETAYELYANKRVVFRHSSAGAVQTKIFQLPVAGNAPGIRPAFVRTGDFFEIVNDPTVNPTRTMIVRTHNSTESIGGTDRQVTLQPNEFIRVEVPPTNLTRWAVVSRGFVSGASGVSGSDGSSMMTATVVTDRPNYETRPWTNGLDGTAYHTGDVHIERIETVVPDNVIYHLTSPADTNNPIALYFDDDQSMIAWWQHILPNQAELQLGNDYFTVQSNIAGGVSWLNTNIGTNYAFELKIPDAVDLAIESFAYVSGTTIRVHVESGVPDLTTIPGFTVGQPIKIEGSSVSELNGNFGLVSVTSAHFEISALDLSSSTIESDSPAVVSLIWYGSVAVASTTNRQYNFNLYNDAQRISPATIGANHFDPDSDIDSVQSALDVPYQAAIERTPRLTLEDEEGTIHYVSSGTIHNIHTINNGDPRFNPLPASDDYQQERTIPEGSPVVHVRTEGRVTIRLPNRDTIPEGQSRQYRIFSDPLNAQHEVLIANQVGVNHFDGTVRALQLRNGESVDIEMYNDGFNVGARILSPIDKVQRSGSVYGTPETATTANTIPMDIDRFGAGNLNQDEGFYFFSPPGSINSDNSLVRLLTEGTSYEFDTKIDVLFNGTEPTGLQFVDVTIMPMLKRVDIGQTSFVDQPGIATTGQLVLSRSGLSGSSAPKSRITIQNSFRRVSTLDEEWRFELRFSSLPTGVTLGDFQLQNLQWTRQAIRGFI